MNNLYLTFLWHMHQPYYKDDFTSIYHLPWVFLHGIKDYLEMPKHHENFNVKAVFNLVPSLIEQIEDLSDGFTKDTLINFISKPVLTLKDDEKNYLLKFLFTPNETNMIKPSRRYYELYKKYKAGGENVITVYELLDIEVHFLLAWTGTFIKEESNFIIGLVEKDRGYFEDEKQHLLSFLEEKFKSILSYYNFLIKNGVIEISTTPFYHPILPLLIDPHCFNEALPFVGIPSNAMSLSKDASWHVQSATEMYKQFFGSAPVGVWPAEGSVSNAALNMFKDNGFKWTATDEDILARTLGVDLKNRVHRNVLYRRYCHKSENGEISVFFRDKELSDLFGFVYWGLEAETASNDFISRLNEIRNTCNFPPHVSVILDGENAWEFYKNNGRDFFDTLYRKLTATDWIKTITFSEAILSSDIPKEELNTIASGSWISGNFATWMGHFEKNAAWSMIYELKKEYERKKDSLNKDEVIFFEKELHIAEGSDWFWWYGDDHYTDQIDVFDFLFRTHIKNGYHILGTKVPDIVDKPIKTSHKRYVVKEPVSEIYTDFDGRLDSIFDYIGAGEVDIKFDLSSMHTDATYLRKMRWGFSGHYLFVMLTGSLKSLKESKEEVHLNIINVTDNETISVSLTAGTILKQGRLLKLNDFKFGDVIELLFFLDPLRHLESLQLMFELYKGDKMIDRAPVYSPITIEIIKKNMNAWIV